MCQESQVPYGYMMTDEQLWRAYVELMREKRAIIEWTAVSYCKAYY